MRSSFSLARSVFAAAAASSADVRRGSILFLLLLIFRPDGLSTSAFAVASAAGASSGLDVVVDDPHTASFSLLVDGRAWFRGGGLPPVVRGGETAGGGALALELQDFQEGTNGTDTWGTYDRTTWWWGRPAEVANEDDEKNGRDEKNKNLVPPLEGAQSDVGSEGLGALSPVVLVTDIRVYRDRELVVFTQTWPRGLSPVPVPSSSSVPFLASFPSFNATPVVAGEKGSDDNDISYLGWGGCMASDIMSGAWESSSLPVLDGATSGSPLLWHDESGRSVVLSPMSNFFVAGQALNATESPWLECGLRGTVESLPEGFVHSTVLFGGHGIESTLVSWGDHLLSIGEKDRTDPYDDFVLSHLGYWTDNGAYYYHVTTGYDNEEDALLAVKADLENRSIPVRYFQWDDWWMESEGDIPGITSWTPPKSVFPSGFTDWLGAPLALYAPNYAADNVWKSDYDWKIDEREGKSAIPLDPKFYSDLFANGTSIGMKMFEQDFLCTINTDLSLTNSDVHSGGVWMQNMDAAAIEHGISLQWCMMNAIHALQSTLVKSVTNGRATGDNCRMGSHDIESMGQTGLLFWALGLLPSRDNVWTSAPDVEQVGCQRRNCFEPNNVADNAVAVLGGGPYGIADKVGYANRTIVMRAARSDGVLLKPSWPLTSLDASFLGKGGGGGGHRRRRLGGASSQKSSAPPVWAARDDHEGVGRWAYVVGVNLEEPFSLTPSDLLPPSASSQSQTIDGGDAAAAAGAMVAWSVNVGVSGDKIEPILFDSSNPLRIPACPPKDNRSPGASLWVAAPVLPNGMVLLGETSKWTTLSGRRFRDVRVVAGGRNNGASAPPMVQNVTLSAAVLGAPGERVEVSYLLSPPSAAAAGGGGGGGGKGEAVRPETVSCVFPAAASVRDPSTNGCGAGDKYGDVDCRMVLSCTAIGCECGTLPPGGGGGEIVSA